MRPAQKSLLWLAIEFILIASLSLVSHYELQRPGYVVNFDIATMLTPSGLLKNVVIDPENILRRFYDRAPEREGLFDSLPICVFAISASGFALFTLVRMRRRLG